jgi:DNA repair exonuclease SbcCD ATPase subunit
MASKIEKAQIEFEKLLCDLAEKARMLDLFDQVDPALIEAHHRAEEGLDDRKLEIEFIESEIERIEKSEKQSKQQLEDELNELQDFIKQQKKILSVKQSKAAPAKKKLVGEEYDFKFADKSMKEEKAKFDQAKKVEDFDKAKVHENNLKRMKIDILKRRKSLDELRRKIREHEKPIKDIEKEIAQASKRAEQIDLMLEEMEGASEEETLSELRQQLEMKSKEVKRAQLLVVDTLADVGENLFDKRVRHPVLNNFYGDIDAVAKVIDEFQRSGK